MAKCKVCEKQVPLSQDEVDSRLKSIMSKPYVEEVTYDHSKHIYTCKLQDDSVYKSADGEAWYKDGSLVRETEPWATARAAAIRETVWDSFMNNKDPNDEVPTQRKIREITDAMKDLLLYKNQKYGDSAINPIEIFTKHLKNVDTKTAAILVRLDDKLSRVKNADTLRTNDICDLIGYLTLLNVALGTTAEDIAKFKD
jgi:hypothetical protein